MDINGYYEITRNVVRLPTEHIRILGIVLELDLNGGSCGGISLKKINVYY